jgi:hypothetical protein
MRFELLARQLATTRDFLDLAARIHAAKLRFAQFALDAVDLLALVAHHDLHQLEHIKLNGMGTLLPLFQSTASLIDFSLCPLQQRFDLGDARFLRFYRQLALGDNTFQ